MVVTSIFLCLIVKLSVTTATTFVSLPSSQLIGIPVVIIFDPNGDLENIRIRSSQYITYVDSIEDLREDINMNGCGNAIVYLHNFDPGLFKPGKHNKALSECIFLVHEEALHIVSMPKLCFDTQLYSFNGTKCWEYYGIGDFNITLEIDCDIITTKKNIWERRHDLYGKYFDVVTLETPGKSGVIFDPDTNTFYGPYIEFLHELSELLNFTYSLREPKDGKWGALLNDGTWNGMVGELHRKEADMSVADLSMSAGRATAIDFAPALRRVHLSVSMHNPAQTNVFQYEAYLLIFDINLWICVILQAVVFIVYLFYFHSIKLSAVLRATFEYSLAKGNLLPMNNKTSTGIANLVFSLSSFMLFTCYCAFLTALMTAAPTNISIKSVQDLFDRGYEMIVLSDTYAHDVLKTETEGGLYNFFNNRMTEGDFAGIPEDIKKEVLRNEKTVTFGEKDLFDVNGQGDIIMLDDFNEKFFVYRCFGFPLNSEFFGLFSYYIRKLQEQGVTQRIFMRWRLIELHKNHHKHIESVFPLAWSHLFALWMILMLGLSTGIAFLCMEIVAKRIVKVITALKAA